MSAGDMSSGQPWIERADRAPSPAEKKGVRLTKTNKPRAMIRSAQETCRSVLYGPERIGRGGTINSVRETHTDLRGET